MIKKCTLLLIVFFTSGTMFGQGAEMLNNTTFTTANYWNTGTGWSIKDGTASYNASGIGFLSQSNANMVSSIQPSTTYTLSFELYLQSGVVGITVMSGDYKIYLDKWFNNGQNVFEFTTPTDIGIGGLFFYTYPYGTFKIDNISLVKNSTIGDDPYYVHPNGSDAASGDINHPWRTWQKAFDVAEPGDTIFFRGGVYYPQSPVVIDAYYGKQKSGTAGEWIYYMAYPGEKPILDLSLIDRTAQWTGLSISWATYIHFKGLTVRNAYQRYPGTITVSGWGMSGTSNIIVENCEVYNIGGRGFAYYGYFGEHSTEYPQVPDVPYDTTRFINCDAYLCQDTLSNDGALGGFGDGFKGSTHLGGYLSYEGCRAWDCSDDGFDPNWQGFINIENCWSFRNGRWDGDGYGFKLATWEARNVELTEVPFLLRNFTNNIAAFNQQGPGLGITYGPERPMCNGNWSNNTFFKNMYGIVVSHSYLSTSTVYNMIFRNNVLYKNVTDFVCSGPPYIAENNNFASSYPYGYVIPTTDDDFIHVDSVLAIAELTATRKSDGSLPDITFLKLKSSSDLIDAGKDVGLPYYGKAPDIGYAEYIDGVIVPATPVILGASIENSTPSRLEITFSLPLANIVPGIGAFTVSVNSSSRSINLISVTGNKVFITLSSSVSYGDKITVSYLKPVTNQLQTSAGGQVANFTELQVKNNCADPNINQAPRVSISSPTKSTAFIAPATVTIDATASDPDGTIIKVEFFNASIKLGERTSPPYTFTWKEVPVGTYSITAVATDNGNLKTISDAVIVVVQKSSTAINQMPEVSIIIPAKSKKFKKNEKIVIEAAALDKDGSISNVRIKNGDITLAEFASAPYLFEWVPVDTGRYMIYATATDNLGAVSESSSIELFVVSSVDKNSDLIRLYPNPSDGLVNIDLSSLEINESCNLNIVDFTGRYVYSTLVSDSHSISQLDVSANSAGRYTLIISDKNSILATKSFIINKR